MDSPVASLIPPSTTASHLRCPPDALTLVEKLSGQSSSSLCCAVISSTYPPLYEALAEYVALSRDQNLPLRVDSGERPLWFEQKVLQNSDSDSDSDSDNYFSDDEESKKAHVRKKVKKISTQEEIDAAKQKQKKKVIYYRPVFHLGFGQTSVTWPPPSHLSSKTLHDHELKLRESRSNNTTNNHPPQPESSEPNEIGNTYYVISYERQERGYDLYRRKQLAFNEITILSKHPIDKFLIELLEWKKDKIPERPSPPNNYLELYRLRIDECSNKCEWNFEGVRRSRGMDSVILKGKQMEDILGDTKNFLKPSSQRWYKKHGIPLRRQYLFHGPPGTGKTSTIRVLSSVYKKSCYFMSVTSEKFSNQILADALFKLPGNSILILEDVDALFQNRANNPDHNGLTFSGFLNALDGILSIDGIITVLTTNHIEKLDNALLRVGRIDKKYYFGPPDSEQIMKLFQNFYPDSDEKLCKEFMEKIRDRPADDKAWSMSTLQELFVSSKDMSAEECVNYVDEYFEEVMALANEVQKARLENGSKEEMGSESEKENGCEHH